MKKILKSKNFTLILILIVLIVVFSFWSSRLGKNFFATSTIKNVLQAIIVTGFLTIGAGCLLISGNMDIAMSTIGCFGLTVIGNACAKNIPGPVALIMMFVMCGLFGLLDGWLVSVMKFPSFIATMGVSFIVKGLTYVYSQWWNNGVATNVNFKDKFIQWFGTTSLFGIPIGAYILILFFICYGIMITKTRFGMKMLLVGGNPSAARLAGINATKVVITLFVNGSILAGISGLFQGSRLGMAGLTALSTNQFTGLTAAMIGGISFGGGIGGMGGALIGLLILNTFQIGMSVVGVNPYWVTTFSGVLLLGALSIDFLKMRVAANKLQRQRRKEVKEAAKNA